MDVIKYTAYFHDGYVNNIIHKDNCIDFYIESSVVDPEELDDRSILSTEGTIKGILKITNIKQIMIGSKKIHEQLTMNYDDGEILDLKVNNNKVFLLVEWQNFPPTNETNVNKIEIEGEEILWFSIE